MDPSYIALLAFNTVSGHFARHSQQRTTTQEGDQQRAFQQRQFEAQREEQRQQAKERREQEWALATRQRQTALELQENQKVLDHWPLRLFPSQILQSHRCDGPTPLRVFLSLPANGPRDLEGPVRQALQQFLSTHYNFNLGVRPIELLDGAWKDGQFQGAASIKALHERLRSEPTLVLETQMPEGDDHLYVNLAYWGPAQDQYLYQTLEKIAYRPLVDASVRTAAQQWRQARERLVEQGVAKDCLDADQRFGGVRAANLKRLEQEEALSAAGIGLDQVDLPPFQLVKEDWRAIHQFLITWHCLIMGWIGDLYHFSYWETPPLLPKLLPDLLHPDFPPEVAHAFIDHYCRSYRAVAAERPAWAPELALQLAAPLAALADPGWAIGQVGQAIQDWLGLRGLPTVAGTGVGVIDGFCAQVGAADGPVGPALLVDPGFLAGLCDAIGHLNRSDLMARLGGAASAAAARQEREQMERERQERQRLERAQQERERLERERQKREHQQRLERENQRARADRWAATAPQDIHGWSTERVQGLQQSVAESLGLGPAFRDPLKNGSEGPEMVLIPPGSFLMGAPASDGQASASEKPQHRVSIARPFAIGRYVVTFDEYDRFCAATGCAKPSDKGWGRGRRPVINVSWNDSVAYCVWLSEQTGRQYRLPTEAEWEYAARAGTATRWSFGDDESALGDYAWFRGNTCVPILIAGKTHQVGEKRPNPWGLYDIHGNVWDWVQDSYHSNYAGAPADGVEWSESCTTARRVLRGGSWGNSAGGTRVSDRNWLVPDYRSGGFGLRLAQDL
ncbi:SUMF1/EgtB/PvdO family nonheme iron enzyme [uncultured Thiodictyon sp.]|jgi:formylglycine-generating enzyme required for sulfatase activity|uniref:formylglycine-generating enzyme family protein n=1 Tax=uncultured Thiodictyon sp. TaxID=1846217 RepID=UPI0025E7C610|nr:SUMF1/EgtB/PvdO family nonheme iron enzyme [uncultured Thiodictyon sp.]